MIALDTNVLVRFLVEDDVHQSARARALVERIVATDDAAFLSDVVLCESVWVLAGAYALGRAEIAEALARLCGMRHVRLESAPRVAAVLDRYAKGKGDFADYLIRETAAEVGCSTTVTFDRKLLREAGFSPP